MKLHPDSLQRFLFEQSHVRGELVHLDAAWHAVLEQYASVGVKGGFLRDLFEQLLDLRVQRRQAGVDGFPDNFQIDLEVAMRQRIAHFVGEA